jgi:hypothetical protein
LRASFQPVWYATSALVVVATLAAAHANATPALEPPAASRGLADAELLVKIVGGGIAGVVALVGLPAAFLQFSKTRAEIKKLRLEAEKLATEIEPGEDRGVVPRDFQILVQDSPSTVLTVHTDAGLAGPMLLLTDFVVAYIMYQAWLIMLGLFPIGGLWGGLVLTPLKALVFAALFIPVYANGRQVRALLRELGRNRSAAEKPATP